MSITIPKFEFVLRDLSFLWPICYSALDYGADHTVGFFKEKKVDPWLASHLVRYHAKEALDRDNGGRFKIENIPNSGLCLHNEKYCVRINKARLYKPPDKLPSPKSISRLQYYQQQEEARPLPGPQLCFPLPELQDCQNSDKLHLVMLWDVDSESKYKIGPISLACPKDAILRQNPVVTYWHHRIPLNFIDGTLDVLHPAEAQDLPLTFSIETETGDDF